MSQGEVTTVDVLGGPSPTEKSSRLHSENSSETTSNILSSFEESLRSQIKRLTIPKRDFKSPSSNKQWSTKTTSSCADEATVVISESRTSLPSDCNGFSTDPGNTHAKPDVENKEHGFTTACHGPVANLPDDHFRGAVQLPGCSPATFVYPHGSEVIDAVYHDRYREVVNIFRHNTREHPRLTENLQYIDYTLRLCGTSSSDSHPSILVFCRHSEFKDLKTLLTSKELKYQYCRRRPSRKYPWSGNQASATEKGDRPFFSLFFWRQRRPRTLYWGQKSVRIHSRMPVPSRRLETHPHMVPGLTMSGSVIELLGNESSFSTLGCVIKLDSEFYAITSMHAFRPFELTKGPHGGEMSDYRLVDSSNAVTSANKDEEPLYGSDTDPFDAMPEDGDYFIDDVEYESLAEDDDEELDPVDTRSTVANSYYGNPTETSGQASEVKEMLALFPTPHELDECGGLDLDWALIKLVDQENWRPNAFVFPSISSSPVFLSTVSESQPTKETPVLIITSEATPQRGLLQPGTSLLGGINGSTPSAVWTVVMSQQNSLKRGDSGSVVVDGTTKIIYGHTIGTNPIGEVYVSPYKAIFKQIQHLFPGSAVAIPEPISTLASLIDFYTESSRDESGLESLGRLKDIYREVTGGSDEVKDVFPHFPQPQSSGHFAGSSLSRRACFKCGNVGHFAEVCSSAERLCYNCKQPGHEPSQCPLPRTSEARQCYHCQGLGHVQADCPTISDRCYNCGQPGHLARVCPNPVGLAVGRGGLVGGYGRGGYGRGGFAGGPRPATCYKCGGPNHFARDCQAQAMKCYACGKLGHISRDCTAPNATPLNTAGKTCYQCGEAGHISRECPQRNAAPENPSEVNIKQRAHRCRYHIFCMASITPKTYSSEPT